VTFKMRHFRPVYNSAWSDIPEHLNL
jgi:hypothetical protein